MPELISPLLRLRGQMLVLGLLAGLVLGFYWKLLMEGLILVSYDLYAYFYPYKAQISAALQEGRLPLWNPWIFTGVPFLANIQTAVLYPFNLLALFLDPPHAVNLSIGLHVFLAGLSMYAFARWAARLGSVGAFLAAVVFMFGGYLSQKVGHINQLNALVWLPLLLLLYHLAYRRQSWWFVLLGSLVLTLQLLAGHTQQVFLSLVVLGWYALLLSAIEAARVKAAHATPASRATFPRLWLPKGVLPWLRPYGRALALFATILALGGGLAALQLLPTYELMSLSPRAGGLSLDDARSFSLPPWLLLWSFLPGYLEYPFSEYIGYVGILPLSLALWAAVVGWRRPYVRFGLGLCALSLFFSVGAYNPLYPWLYQWVPGVSQFRVPARWLLLSALGLALLAGLGLDNLMRQGARQIPLTLLPRGLGRRVLLALALILLTAAFLNYSLLPPPQVLALWLVGALASLGLIAYGALIGGRERYAAVVALLVVAELFFASRGMEFNRPVPDSTYRTLRPALSQLLLDTSLYRILSIASPHYDPGDLRELRDLFGRVLPAPALEDYVSSLKYKEVVTPNLPLLYGLATIDGYDGGLLPLSRYVTFKQLILESGGLDPDTLKTTDPSQPDALLRFQLGGIPRTQLLGALNVKYIVDDKLDDLWLHSVYYDMSADHPLESNQPLVLEALPLFESSGLGLITSLVGGQGIPQGVEVARLKITDTRGQEVSFVLQAGIHTAHPEAARPQAKVAHQPPRAATMVQNRFGDYYHALLALPEPRIPKKIEMEYLLPQGVLQVQSLSLIDRRTFSSESLVVRPRLKLVYSGDVKIYQNLDWLPRAFIVHEYQVASDPTSLFDALRGDLTREVVFSEPPKDAPRPTVKAPHGPAQASAPDSRGKGPGTAAHPANVAALPEGVRFLEYAPELVVLEAQLQEAGFLVLTDTHYPGWRAWVDGKEVDVLRADYLFRAVPLSEGKHKVEFRYVSPSFAQGLHLTQLTALMVVLASLLALGLRLVRSHRPAPGGPAG